MLGVDEQSGIVSLGFSSPLEIDGQDLADSGSGEVAIRRELRQEVRLFKDDDPEDIAAYDVYKIIEIQLTSTVNDTVDPVPVNWFLLDFDGQQAHL